MTDDFRETEEFKKHQPLTAVPFTCSECGQESSITPLEVKNLSPDQRRNLRCADCRADELILKDERSAKP